MARDHFNDTIDDLFEREKWKEARKLLQEASKKDPESHWMLTQLGVTYYEQRRYEEALERFLASLGLDAECPLTLWHLAGTLDALGKHTAAIEIFTWLLETNRSPAKYSCWESPAWADKLKTDCLYRLGVCFRHLGKKKNAEHCYRQYLNLVLIGANGMYSIEDVARNIRRLHGAAKHRAPRGEIRKAVNTALQTLGRKSPQSRSRMPPSLDEIELMVDRRAAGKR
jgi:tetratricopeptide (TPR) repeat protein